MKDVSRKPSTLRTARAVSSVYCLPETIAALQSGNVPKSDPLGVAKVAAIQAAKNTSLLVPYCHQVPLDFVGVEVEVKDSSVHFFTEVKAVWKTGVEMEALVAASTAALTLYDMLKPIDDNMEIGSIRLTEKRGGKSDFGTQEAGKTKVGILVISDGVSEGVREDFSGRAIKERLEALGVPVVDFTVVPDERAKIEQHLLKVCDVVDLVLTTGGTGLGPRDVTPEATSAVVQKTLPGIEEFLRSHGQERTRFSMLGRGVAGIRGKTIIVNFPGSLSGVNDSMDILLPWIFHAFDVIRGEPH
jgi:cyclic pyranopterin phosphate synthase